MPERGSPDFDKLEQDAKEKLNKTGIDQESPDLKSYDISSKTIKEFFGDKPFPDNYQNDVRWWGNISRAELGSELGDGTKKILTMDIDIGNECSLGCPHCFRRTENADKKPPNGWLSDAEVIDYILAAKELGLKQIKILGRGEPFQNPNFLSFLRKTTKEGIGVAIFTKGHVIGSDELVEAYYGKQYKTDQNLKETNEPIKTSVDLVEELKKLDISILLGFNSFNQATQEEFVGTRENEKVLARKEYVKYRDNALLLLAKAGFNEYQEGQATRLAMIAAPVKPENIDQIFNLYKWARTRNIYMLTCPTTETTRVVNSEGQMERDRQKEFKEFPQKVEDLWVDIYNWAIEKNLIPLRKFLDEGASLYPGCHVCNQTAAGFYLNLSGQVNQCPGRFDADTVFSKDIRSEGVDDANIVKFMHNNDNQRNNIDKESREYQLAKKTAQLKKVWTGSVNYKRARGQGYNYRCAARDGYSLEAGFYKRVEGRVIKNILENQLNGYFQTITDILDLLEGQENFIQTSGKNISQLKNWQNEINKIRETIDEMKDESVASREEVDALLREFNNREKALEQLINGFENQKENNQKLNYAIEEFKNKTDNVMRLAKDITKERAVRRAYPAPIIDDFMKTSD